MNKKLLVELGNTDFASFINHFHLLPEVTDELLHKKEEPPMVMKVSQT